MKRCQLPEGENSEKASSEYDLEVRQSTSISSSKQQLHLAAQLFDIIAEAYEHYFNEDERKDDPIDEFPITTTTPFAYTEIFWEIEHGKFSLILRCINLKILANFDHIISWTFHSKFDEIRACSQLSTRKRWRKSRLNFPLFNFQNMEIIHNVKSISKVEGGTDSGHSGWFI